MKKYFKDYTEHLPAIILLFYILGFSYQFFYYQYFGIEIQYYVTLTDIIFQSIGNILRSVFLFFFIEAILLLLSGCATFIFTRWKDKIEYNKLEIASKKRADRYLEYLIDKYRIYYSFIIVIIISFVGLFIFDNMIYFFSIIFLNCIYRTYRILPKLDQEFDNIIKTGISIFLFLILISSYSYWGLSDAYHIAKDYSSKVIKTEKIYTGDNTRKFIGETSLYFFILNTKNNVVTVINKSSVDELDIEPNKYQIEEFSGYLNDIKGFTKRLRDENKKLKNN